MRVRSLMLVCSLALSGPLAPAAHSQTLGLKEIAGRADIAFHGTVVSILETVDAERGMAFSHVTFAVHEEILDRAESLSSQVTLVFAGGRVGAQLVRVSGVPQFELGQEVVAFARDDGIRYSSPIIGSDRGLFRVTRDTETGEAYALSAGGRGVFIDGKGRMELTRSVAGVRGGVVRYRPVRTLPGLTRAGAPASIAGRETSQSAIVHVPRRGRPESLARLARFKNTVRRLLADSLQTPR